MLEEYRDKRDFSRTAEPPPGEVEARQGPLLFCVQKHAARRLHYDFRLEVDGVLKSWPIPKGPSYDPAERRLAVMTEDHPLDYASFEGVIPKGEYGGGQVIVWDAGIYAPEDRGQVVWDRARAEKLVRRGIEQGKLTILVHGRKLKGLWTLVHTRDRDWLFLKKDDPTASPSLEITDQAASVLSGLTIEDLQEGRLPDRARSAPLRLEPARLSGARRAPLPRLISPMLPSLAERPFSNPNWLFEPKLDGYRVIASLEQGEVRLASRRGLDCTDQYPWLVEALRRQPYTHMALDGEVVALDENDRPSFQHLQNRMHDPKVCLLYYAFDILYRDGVDVRGVRLDERKQLLEQSLVPGDRVKLVDVFSEEGEMLYAAAQASGLEGVVAKRRDSRYDSGKRTDAWLKVKAVQRDEFVVGGYTRGTGARSRTFGSLVLGQYAPGADKLTYVGNAGSGFDDKTLDALVKRLEGLRTDASPFDGPIPTLGRWTRRERAEGPITFVRPELVAEIKYAERTQEGILRAPVFLGLRDDKPPREVGPAHTVAAPSMASLADQLRASDADKLVLEVDGYELAFSNLNKVFWPAHDGQRPLSKRDLVIYYAEVAPYLLPHTRDRPLTLVRFPNGITGQHFYQKHLEKGLPPFVETVWLYSDHVKGDGEYLMINNLPTLLWLGQLADLELHTWYSRVNPEPDARGKGTVFAGSLETMHASVLNYPDFIVFDLDPYLYSGKEARGAEPELHPEGFAATCEVALLLKELLDDLRLASFVKTTGKTGLHIYVPIQRSLDYEATHSVSETLARYLVQQHPDLVTAEWAVPKRKGKVFADYNQNVRGKTLASIYSPRVLPWAAVSMPLRWDEVGKVFPTDFTILTAVERLRQVGDLWAGMLDAKRDLGAALGLTSAA